MTGICGIICALCPPNRENLGANKQPPSQGRGDCVNYIYFEHHFHNMLNKDYTFTQVHNFLTNNGFKKVFKTKMFYRKTFEYIYKNTKI